AERRAIEPVDRATGAPPSAAATTTTSRNRTGPARIADAAVATLRLLPKRRARPANEGDALAVRRPRRARVEVDARRDVVDVTCPHVVHGDERMVVADAHEGELRPVGRPARRGLT